MFFTGFTRFSSDVQKINNRTENEEKKKILKEMLLMVDEAEEILNNKNRDLDDFGRLLDKSWRLKKTTGNAISTENIDKLYERGINAGALGGKLLGAGGGGFIVFYVQPGNQQKVLDEMKDIMYIPFKFENGGTRVIHYTPEEYIPKKEEKK